MTTTSLDDWIHNHPIAHERLGATPQWVVTPQNDKEVEAAMERAHAENLTLCPVASGRYFDPLSSTNTQNVAVLSIDNLANVHALDEESAILHVGAGARLGDIESFLQASDLTLAHLGPFPEDASIGGWLGNALPITPVMGYPTFRGACIGLTAVFGPKKHLHYTLAPRKASGPDLRAFFMGASRGNGGVITSVSIAAARRPARREVIVASASTSNVLLLALRDALLVGVRPWRAEVFGADSPLLYVEVAGTEEHVQFAKDALEDALKRHAAPLVDAPTSLPFPSNLIAAPERADLLDSEVIGCVHATYPTLQEALSMIEGAAVDALVTRATPHGGLLVLRTRGEQPVDPALLDRLAALPWDWRRKLPQTSPAQWEKQSWATRWREENPSPRWDCSTGF